MTTTRAGDALATTAVQMLVETVDLLGEGEE